MLRRLGERIAAASCLVSYNGKTFDWPLLRTRFIMNRIPAPELPPHLDLLHCTRRVLKPSMGSVRLTEVERELLGFYREDDVDGALIPGLYLSYLRGGDPEPLSGVLEHNRHDLGQRACKRCQFGLRGGSERSSPARLVCREDVR